ncbi:Holliday junction branch migration protein RuvA [Puniceicoccaceae bacterium K14]|nr:Holliday junction branch migration protein RuvA [Puniceicoccaceae bacterium K14]
MIVTIEGILARAGLVSAIIDVGGLGHQVNIPVTTAERLPQEGQRVKLHTHVVYREDSQNMYAFWDERERDLFVLLIEKVSGVGPKAGVSMMSKLPLESLIAAISNGDAKLLAKTPGIGPKTAERVIIELKDKLGGFKTASVESTSLPANLSNSSSFTTNDEDAIMALTALGYKPAEAAKAVKKAIDSTSSALSTEEVIKLALGR